MEHLQKVWGLEMFTLVGSYVKREKSLKLNKFQHWICSKNRTVPRKTEQYLEKQNSTYPMKTRPHTHCKRRLRLQKYEESRVPTRDYFMLQSLESTTFCSKRFFFLDGRY